MLLAASLVCTAIYIYMWHKHFDVNFIIIFTLVPIACIGYVMSELAVSIEGSIRATQIIYLGGCFLQLFILFSIFNMCRIEIGNIARVILFAQSAIMYAFILTIGKGTLFYKSISFDIVDGVRIVTKEYGFVHTLFYIEIGLYFITSVIAIIYALIKKNQAPRRVLYLLFIPDVICVLSFFAGRALIKNVDLVPLGYVIAQLVYLLIAYRVNLYDVSETVIDSYVQEQKVGYMSFDFRLRYLGSNDVAKEIIPGLKNIHVDSLFGYDPEQRRIRHYLDNFRNNEEKNTAIYTVHDKDGNHEKDRIYNVTVNYLYEGKRKRGYIVTYVDDTANRQLIKFLDNYKDKLQNEVEEKTEHIVERHDNLIVSMAMLVESRDNSTGGHIKRTSEGVRILIDEISKVGAGKLPEEFCKDVIKAAPMHDLGKIAVDDEILRKPGKFTPEEYEKMKTHAAEGARVIHEILANTDDVSFKTVAENVAHYHHERWDGSGYPEKLSGEQIPLEARIMAIADVYDALVSKRVYKEAFDFEKADRIIMEGMGTQFDPRLKPAYEKARPRLEEYYRQLQEG